MTPARRRSATIAAMAPRIARHVALLMLAGAMSSGCSFFFVKPSAYQPLSTADCTQEPHAPIVDVLLAGASGATAFYLATRATDPSSSAATTKEDDVAIAATTSLFFVGSSVMGFSRVRACRAARAALVAPPPPRPPIVTSQR